MKTLAIAEYNLNQLEKLKQKYNFQSHNSVISWLLVKAEVRTDEEAEQTQE